jgi:hypothetical protein
MGLKVTNNAFGTLNAGISNSDTIIVLEAGQGARFPVLGAGDYFYATLIDTSNQLEIVKVTARATDTLTVVRAQDGTTARAYNVNDRFELRPTAALFNEKSNDDEVVKLTGAQTIAGVKTFSDDPVMGASGLTGNVAAARITDALNATGSAPIFACRAWVNFNGTTTTPTIRASGNVSSVTRNGTGQYTVNFATAMPDANYCATTSAVPTLNSGGIPFHGLSSLNTTSVGVRSTTGSQFDDTTVLCVSIFR